MKLRGLILFFASWADNDWPLCAAGFPSDSSGGYFAFRAFLHGAAAKETSASSPNSRAGSRARGCQIGEPKVTASIRVRRNRGTR
jgi:hypothetical protein